MHAVSTDDHAGAHFPISISTAGFESTPVLCQNWTMVVYCVGIAYLAKIGCTHENFKHPIVEMKDNITTELLLNHKANNRHKLRIFFSTMVRLIICKGFHWLILYFYLQEATAALDWMCVVAMSIVKSRTPVPQPHGSGKVFPRWGSESGKAFLGSMCKHWQCVHHVYHGSSQLLPPSVYSRIQ